MKIYNPLNSTDDDNDDNDDYLQNKNNNLEQINDLEQNDNLEQNDHLEQNVDLDKNMSICFKLLIFLLSLFVAIYIILIMSICCFTLIYVLCPSYLNYCDDNYKKCDFYQTNSILINNTIIESYDNYNIKYKMLSSYKYFNGFENKTCVNLEIHNYETYYNAKKVSELTIGTTKDIFVPILLNDNSCKLNYQWKNNELYYISIFVRLNFIFKLIPLILIIMNYHTFITKKCVIINFPIINNVKFIEKNKYIKIYHIICFLLIPGIHLILKLNYKWYNPVKYCINFINIKFINEMWFYGSIITSSIIIAIFTSENYITNFINKNIYIKFFVVLLFPIMINIEIILMFTYFYYIMEYIKNN